jgi:predicted small lipoprotein YifL
MVRLFSFGLAVAAVASLTACGGGGPRRSSRIPPATLTQIGVNSYLWRAALDTVSFAPIAQTDSAGGVIVTEWYVNPADPTDRVKVSVAILDATLRADALRVTAARQRLQNGQWVDAPVAAATVQRLEEIILTRARDLRRGARVG